MAEGPLHLVPIRGVTGRVGDRRIRSAGELQLDPATPSPSKLVLAGPDEEAIQPAVEALRIPQAPEVDPGANERILHGIARELAVSEDEPGRGVQAVDGRAGEDRERVVVAALRARHQVSLHAAHLLVVATPMVALPSMSFGRRERVPRRR
jgi:hypothetical protein